MDSSGQPASSTWIIASDDAWLHASCQLTGACFVPGVHLELDCGPDRLLRVRALTATGERAPVQRHAGLYGPAEVAAQAVAAGRRPWTVALVTWAAAYVVQWPEPEPLPFDPDAREWALAGRRVWTEAVGRALADAWATLEPVWSAHLDMAAMPAAEGAGGGVALYNRLVSDAALCRHVEAAPVLGHLYGAAGGLGGPLPTSDEVVSLEARLQHVLAFRARQPRDETLHPAVHAWAQQVTCAPEFWPGLIPGAQSVLLDRAHVLSVPAVAWQLHDLAVRGALGPDDVGRVHTAHDWQLVHLLLAMIPRVAAHTLRQPHAAWRTIAAWSDTVDARAAGVAPGSVSDDDCQPVPLDVLLSFARWLAALVEADGTGRLRATGDISLALLVARVRRARRRTPAAVSRLLHHGAALDVPFANPVPADSVLFVGQGEALVPVSSLAGLREAHEQVGGGVGANVAAYHDGRAHLFRIIDDRQVARPGGVPDASIHRGLLEVSPDGRIRKLWVRGGVGRSAAWWTATEARVRESLHRQ